MSAWGMKIRILDEEHFYEVQDALFEMGYNWTNSVGVRKKEQETSDVICDIIFTHNDCRGKIMADAICSSEEEFEELWDDAYFAEATLENLKSVEATLR